jgi:hypothetical protein
MRCLPEAETVLAEQVEELVDEMHEVKGSFSLVNDRQGNFGQAVGFSAPAWMPSKESGDALRSHDEFDA